MGFVDVEGVLVGVGVGERGRERVKTFSMSLATGFQQVNELKIVPQNSDNYPVTPKNQPVFIYFQVNPLLHLQCD